MLYLWYINCHVICENNDQPLFGYMYIANFGRSYMCAYVLLQAPKAWGWLKHTIGTYGKLSRGQLPIFFKVLLFQEYDSASSFRVLRKLGQIHPYQCSLQANSRNFTIYNYSKIYCRFICKKIGMSLSWNRKNTIPFSKVQKIFFQFAMIQCPVLSNDSYQSMVFECY